MVGLDGNQPKVMFSPAVTLFLRVPLGYVGPKAGLILWLETREIKRKRFTPAQQELPTRNGPHR